MTQLSPWACDFILLCDFTMPWAHSDSAAAFFCHPQLLELYLGFLNTWDRFQSLDY